MKSRIKFLAIAVLLIVILSGLSACDLFGGDKKNKLTVTFNADGGTPVPTKSVNVGATIDDAMTPEKTGYVFDGWFIDNGTFSVSIIGYEFDSDTTVYAKWTAEEYSISYSLDDGENNPLNPESYTFESAEIKILPPVKEGFAFDGWEEGDTIPSGSTGDKIFTAKWIVVDGSSASQAFPMFIEIPSIAIGEIDENGTWFRVDLENDAPLRLEIVSQNQHSLSAALYSQGNMSSALITSSNQEWDVLESGRYYIKISSTEPQSGAVLLSLPPVVEFDELLNLAQIEYTESIWRTLVVEENNVLMANSEPSKDALIFVYDPLDLNNEILYADYLGYNSLQKGRYYIRIDTGSPNKSGAATLNYCTELTIGQSMSLTLTPHEIRWFKLTLEDREAIEISFSGGKTVYAALYSSLDIENEIMLIENDFAMSLEQGEYFFKVFANLTIETEFKIASCLLLENGVSNSFSYGPLKSGKVFWGRIAIEETSFFALVGFSSLTPSQYYGDNAPISSLNGKIVQPGEYFIKAYNRLSTGVINGTIVTSVTPINNIQTIVIGQTKNITLDVGDNEFFKFTIDKTTNIYLDCVNTKTTEFNVTFDKLNGTSTEYLFSLSTFYPYILEAGTYIIRISPSISSYASSGTFTIIEWNNNAEKSLALGSYVDNTAVNGKLWYNMQLNEDAIIQFDVSGYGPQQIIIYHANDLITPVVKLIHNDITLADLKAGSYKICGIMFVEHSNYAVRMRARIFDLNNTPSLTIGTTSPTVTSILPLDGKGYATGPSSIVFYKFTLSEETTLWHDLKQTISGSSLVFTVIGLNDLSKELIGGYGVSWATHVYAAGTYVVGFYVLDYNIGQSSHSGKLTLSVLTAPQSAQTLSKGSSEFTVSNTGSWFKFVVGRGDFVNLSSYTNNGRTIVLNQDMNYAQTVFGVFPEGTYYIFSGSYSSSSSVSFTLTNACSNISLNTEVTKSVSTSVCKLSISSDTKILVSSDITTTTSYTSYFYFASEIHTITAQNSSTDYFAKVINRDIVSLPAGEYYISHPGGTMVLTHINESTVAGQNSYSASTTEKIYSLQISERAKISLSLNQTAGSAIVAIFAKRETYTESVLILSFEDSGSLYLDEGDYYIVVASRDGNQATGFFTLVYSN